LADDLADDGLLDRLPPAPVEPHPPETLNVDELPQMFPGDALTDVSILKALRPHVASWTIPKTVLDCVVAPTVGIVVLGWLEEVECDL